MLKTPPSFVSLLAAQDHPEPLSFVFAGDALDPRVVKLLRCSFGNGCRAGRSKSRGSAGAGSDGRGADSELTKEFAASGRGKLRHSKASRWRPGEGAGDRAAAKISRLGIIAESASHPCDVPTQ